MVVDYDYETPFIWFRMGDEMRPREDKKVDILAV